MRKTLYGLVVAIRGAKEEARTGSCNDAGQAGQ